VGCPKWGHMMQHDRMRSALRSSKQSCPLQLFTLQQLYHTSVWAQVAGITYSSASPGYNNLTTGLLAITGGLPCIYIALRQHGQWLTTTTDVAYPPFQQYKTPMCRYRVVHRRHRLLSRNQLQPQPRRRHWSRWVITLLGLGQCAPQQLNCLP